MTLFSTILFAYPIKVYTKRRRFKLKRLKIGEIDKWKKVTNANERRQEQKSKIREAFANAPEVEFIPAKIKAESETSRKLRVAAYCRVSTYEDAQAGSYELQVQHYREMIESKSDWELVEIYADEGVSGTSMKKRINFLRMIDDCCKGKIDLIMTKSVSRFARNTRDCLDVIRRLKALDPPVGVIFEIESLNTIESKNEFTLGVMSLVAQGESEQKSAAIIWSVIERFKKGIPILSTHNLLGYDKDHFGKMVIVEEEAEVIKYIYACYMDGQTASEIALSLMQARVPTIRGGEKWSGSSVLNILRNEKYCGDVLMQKTFTVDCFSHKTVKNTGQRPQYRLRNHHPAIISRDDWLKVQEELQHRRCRSKKEKKPIEKKLYITRIKSGGLKGFFLINPKWNRLEIDEFLKKTIINNFRSSVKHGF